MSILYANLADYIITRANEMGYSISSLSKALGYGDSYISAAIRGQFKPSQKRCLEIAEFFGDDPNIILGLVGYYRQPPETELTTTLAHIIDDLPKRLRHTLLDYAMFLRTHKPSPAVRERRAPYFNIIYIELPDGETLELELPPDIADKITDLSPAEIGDLILDALRAIPE